MVPETAKCVCIGIGCDKCDAIKLLSSMRNIYAADIDRVKACRNVMSIVHSVVEFRLKTKCGIDDEIGKLENRIRIMNREIAEFELQEELISMKKFIGESSYCYDFIDDRELADLISDVKEIRTTAKSKETVFEPPCLKKVSKNRMEVDSYRKVKG